MDVLPSSEFMQKTVGGRPNQMDVSIYTGKVFDCACGQTHKFDPLSVDVLRELPGMKLVLACPDGKAVNCVKVKGIFRVRLNTLFGTHGQE